MPKNAAPAFVNESYFSSLLDFTCRQTGIEQSMVYRSIFMTPSATRSLDLFEQDQRIPSEYFYRLITWGATTTQDQCFGLHFGDQVSAKTFSVLAYLALSAENLLQAVKLLEQYEVLASSLGRATLTETDDGCWLSWAKTDKASSHHVEDAVLAGWIRFARILTGVTVAPLKVSVTHRHSDYQAAYQKIWRCPVNFGCSETRIQIEKESLRLPIENSDVTVNQLLQQQAQAMLEKHSDLRHSDLTEQVKRLISELYLEHRITLAAVAEKLAISERSLQRKLKQHDVSFKQLWDEFRKQTALAKVLDERVCLSDLGDELQFSEQSAWSRAFKRWTGFSPLQYRKLNRQ